MNSKPEPWYIHAALYAVIAILVVILVKVAILDPQEIVETDRFNRKESRLRMENLKEAQMLYFKKNKKYTDNLDSLITFVKTDRYVDSVRNAFDSLSRKPADPFVPLSAGQFVPDSIRFSPRSHSEYIVQIDSSTTVDTVVNRTGKVLRLDTTVVIGARYYIEDPDGYGTIGSTTEDAKKNVTSWE